MLCAVCYQFEFDALERGAHGEDVYGDKEVDLADRQMREGGVICNDWRVNGGDSGKGEARQLPAGRERFEESESHLLGFLRRIGQCRIKRDKDALGLNWRTAEYLHARCWVVEADMHISV